jgi:hypothetical protein
MLKPKQLITLVFVVLAVVAGEVWLHATPFPPPTTVSLGTLAAFPTVLTANTPSIVTFTLPVPDTSLIPNSINLLRFGAAGTQPTVLGVMADDGKNGDAVAGDGIYTLQVTFNAPIGQFAIAVSAAFRGRLERVLSNQITIAVTATGTRSLPPDPGAAGLTTLAGIDSDGDGVRDDVERYIALTYPNSAKTEAALTQIAIAMQSEVVDAPTQSLAVSEALEWSYATDCLDSVTATGDADVVGLRDSMDIANALKAQILNTPARAQAYFQADAQLGAWTYSRPNFAGLSARCAFNPMTLPN